MSKYESRKNEIRDEAIFWQATLTGTESYGELAEKQTYFETMGRRYGLLKEFRENGII